MKDIKRKSFLIVPLCLLLLGSALTPSMAFLHDLKMELMALEDFSEEETTVFENECFEKEMVPNDGERHDLLLSIISTQVNDFRQLSLVNHSGDVFLPPPEILS